MRTQPTEGTLPSPDKPKGFRGAVVHRSHGAVLLTVLAMAAALAGCTSHRPSASSPPSAVAQQLARSGATSVIVFVSDHGHSTVATAGTPPSGSWPEVPDRERNEDVYSHARAPARRSEANRPG